MSRKAICLGRVAGQDLVSDPYSFVRGQSPLQESGLPLMAPRTRQGLRVVLLVFQRFHKFSPALLFLLFHGRGNVTTSCNPFFAAGVDELPEIVPLLHKKAHSGGQTNFLLFARFGFPDVGFAHLRDGFRESLRAGSDGREDFPEGGLRL